MRSSKYAIVLVVVLGVLFAFAVHQYLSRFGSPDEKGPNDGRIIGETYIHDRGWHHGYGFWNGPYVLHFFTDSGDEYWLGDYQFKPDKK